MMWLDDTLKGFNKYADLPIRLLVGIHLIIGTQDNVFSWERMHEFENFLQSYRMPLPLFSAVLSVYAQFIAGILFIIGWQVRVAAAVMIFNFIVAILLVHLGDSYAGMFPALVMLAGSLYLLMNGSGAISLDAKLRK